MMLKNRAKISAETTAIVMIKILYLTTVLNMPYELKYKVTTQSLKTELKSTANPFLIGFVPLCKTATFVNQIQHFIWNCLYKYLSFY